MVDKQALAPFEEIQREKPAATRNECAAIVWHEAQRSRCESCGVA